MPTYRPLIPYVLRQRNRLVVIFALTAASSAVVALQPWPMKLLVDYALREVDSPQFVTSLLAAVGLAATPTVLVILAAVTSVALFAVTSAISVGLSLSWNMAGQHMVYDLAGDLFARAAAVIAPLS